MIVVSRHTAAAAVLAVVVLGPAASTAQTPAEKQSFPAQTEVVTVDVVVTDRGGAPVLDLKQDDFAVSEDGVHQEVVAFDAVHRPAPTAPVAGTPARATPQPRATSNHDAAAREAASFVIVFDELHLDVAEAARGRRAVADFLNTGVADGDRVGVVGTAEGVRWTAAVPDGREALLKAVGRFQGKLQGEMVRDAMSEYEAMRIDQERDPLVTDQVMRRFIQTGQIQRDTKLAGDTSAAGISDSDNYPGWRQDVQARAAQVYVRAAARLEQSLGVIERSLESLADTRGRKSLVLVSGGLMQDTRLGVFRQVVTAARRANTAIYFLDVRGLSAVTAAFQTDMGVPTDTVDVSAGVGLNESRDRSEGSEGLAVDTGGFVLKNRNDLSAGLARIGRESRSFYLLGYTPTNRTADGRFRKIEVKVARPGVTVRARRGYYAPGKDDGKKPAGEGRDAAIQRALDAPFDLADVPLRAIADVFAENEPGKARVRLTVEADVRNFAFAEKGGTARDVLEFLLLVARRDTGEFTRFDQQFEMNLKPETRARYEKDGFPIVREVALAPGRYQARVVARDHNSGRLGSLVHEFEVPEVKGLRVSSLALTDRVGDARAGESPVPEPTARRLFAPAGTMHCRFEVYGAGTDSVTGKPKLTAGLSIRRSDGRFLAAMPETPLSPGKDGSLARAVGIPLDGAPPGLYEAIVVVTDLAAGRSAEAREAFQIGAER
ncbi:MAG TPA: VWA domain-containing protein [Vicinamibacteria bacterium]|nr:VWA domain-containing protein [Vicinamibacteria bacterium]